MTSTQQEEVFDIPRLGSVTISGRNIFPDSGFYRIGPTITIKLAADYTGDLRDWERNNSLPADVYFVGDNIAAITQPEFTRFMEVMNHWDHDNDGVFDCDHIIARINQVFTLWDDQSALFRRPSGPINSILMKMMPPQPARHITYNFGELKPKFRLEHYKLAIPMLIVFIGIMQLQIHTLTFTKYSPMSAWFYLAENIGLLPAVIVLAAIMLAIKLFPSASKGKTTTGRHTFGLLNKAAVYEEQAFREGSENWDTWQRIRSHVAFGAIHQGNLFYPVATILPLALAGALFMKVYRNTMAKTKFRRSAVLEASLVHRVYNRMALVTVLVVMTTLLGYGVVSSLAFVGTQFAVDGLITELRRRLDQT